MCDLQSVQEQLAEIEDGCKETNTQCKEVYEAATPALLNLPVEIILKICSFLDAHFLKYTLSKVCRRFRNILADDHLWRYWVHSKINGYYPTLPSLKIWDEVQIDWEEVCVEMDDEKKKWCNVKDTMRHIVVKDVHFASVDTVLLVNNGEICISGGRDRGMALWNVLDISPHDQSDNSTTLTDAKPKYVRDAHAGWVWDLAPDNIENASVVYSASWDSTVKAWDLATELRCTQTFRSGMSVLSVVAHEADKSIMAGLYSKKIVTFDHRVGSNPVTSYKAHKGPVLALCTFKNLVGSVSEDKTLAVWDKVAGKILVNDVKITDKSYPVCISWSPSALYVGDSKGCLHLLHPEDYVYIKSHEIWPEQPITKPSSKIIGCHQSPGNMIVSSDRGDIKFFYNCSPPQEYSSIKTSTFEVTRLRYLNGVMVVGTCDSDLEFWVPKERYDDL